MKTTILTIQRLDRKEPTEEDKNNFAEFPDGAAIIKWYDVRPFEALLVNRGGVEYELYVEEKNPVIVWVK